MDWSGKPVLFFAGRRSGRMGRRPHSDSGQRFRGFLCPCGVLQDRAPDPDQVGFLLREQAFGRLRLVHAARQRDRYRNRRLDRGAQLGKIPLRR